MVAVSSITACETIKSIAGEYNGITGESTGSENSAYITAYIPADSVDEFIASLEYAGLVSSCQLDGDESGTATVTISIKQN